MAFPEQNKPTPGPDKSKQGESPVPGKDLGKTDKQQNPEQPGKAAQIDPQKQRTPQ